VAYVFWTGLQWRSQEFSVGGTKARTHGERAPRGARAYTGVWGQSPQRVPGAEPPEAESFLTFGRPSNEANLHPFRNFAKSVHLYLLNYGPYISTGFSRDYFLPTPWESRNIKFCIHLRGNPVALFCFSFVSTILDE